MRRPTDSVRIVLFEESDPSCFLILCEADDRGNWKLPGGKFDDDQELPVVAAARELREELDIESTDIGLTTASELTNDDGVSKRYIFTARVDRSVIKPSHEISDIRWVTSASVPTCKNREHILSAYESSGSVDKAA